MRKIFELILILILIVKTMGTATLEVEAAPADENEAEADAGAETEADTDTETDTSAEDLSSLESDDVKGRSLRKIELYTDDARCNSIGVCSGFDYGDEESIVSFSHKMEIRITSKSTYSIKEPRNRETLTFVDSNFTNFPLQLFCSFKPQELDFRNCSLVTLKWDNFLGAEMLSILLLSENRLQEIRPSLFYLAENLAFLFLDGNRISVLHSDSFKGLEKLNFLDLHNNLIETLPSKIFSYLPALQQINLAENRLRVIKSELFINNPRLFSLHLQYNALQEIQDYAFQAQRVIKYLDFSHNQELEILLVTNIRVENLWAKNCSINRVNIYGEAVHVDLQQNAIKELYFSQPEYLETLRLKDNALEQIASLSLSSNLKTLDVSNNPGLRTLPDLMQLYALERLDLSNTSLQEIPLSLLISPNKLRSLNVSFNQIKEINPLHFKYLEKLTQFYIQHNNWNCYNLKMLMDLLIRPLQISYTYDEFDDNYPGEYIHGIKCMYRIESADDDEFYVDTLNSPQTYQSYRLADSREESGDNHHARYGNSKEVSELRSEFKTVIGIQEQKFAIVLNKLHELDLRLKQFERFNETVWQQVAIVV